MHLGKKCLSGLALTLIACQNAAADSGSSSTNPSDYFLFSSAKPFVNPFHSILDKTSSHTIVQFGSLMSFPSKSNELSGPYLPANQYNLNKQTSNGGLLGLGYFIDAQDKDRYFLSYGINGFYLGKTPVNSKSSDNTKYTSSNNLYDIQHIPIYLAAKAHVKDNTEFFNITFDAGVGPNFMRTTDVGDPMRTSYSATDNPYASHTNVALAATAGVGLRLNRIFGKSPLECGYRFYYLGQGQLPMANDQLINTIKTGNNYANALMCSATV